MDDCFLNLIYIMKKNILLLSFLCNFSLLLSAQTNVEKGLQSINRSSAEATINFLASDELQGREAGFHGSRVTSEYIASLLQWMGVSPLADSYFQPFDAYRKERQKKGRLEVHPDSIAKLKQEVHQKLSMRNVLGMIPGKNTKEYVIVGAHFDHLGIDPALDGVSHNPDIALRDLERHSGSDFQLFFYKFLKFFCIIHFRVPFYSSLLIRLIFPPLRIIFFSSSERFGSILYSFPVVSFLTIISSLSTCAAASSMISLSPSFSVL